MKFYLPIKFYYIFDMEFVCNLIELINKTENKKFVFKYFQKSDEWHPNKFSNNQKQILTSFQGQMFHFLLRFFFHYIT